jgi:hypothetical protein
MLRNPESTHQIDDYSKKTLEKRSERDVFCREKRKRTSGTQTQLPKAAVAKDTRAVVFTEFS